MELLSAYAPSWRPWSKLRVRGARRCLRGEEDLVDRRLRRMLPLTRLFRVEVHTSNRNRKSDPKSKHRGRDSITKCKLFCNHGKRVTWRVQGVLIAALPVRVAHAAGHRR